MSPKICPQCGNIFSPKYKSQKLCSRACSAAKRRKPPVFNTCDQCGVRFQTNRFDLARGYGRFCSRECKSLAQKKRVTLTCEYCGETFQVRPCESDQRFCSHDCAIQSRKQYVTCKHCGKSFWDNRGVGRVYCSNRCQGLAQRNYVHRECETCGSGYEAPLNRRKRFCSAQCAKKFSMMDDGIQTDYVGFTEGLKESIRKRDKRRCQLCGKKPHIRKLDVHHINYRKNDCHPKNLISLCLICHPKTNYDRKYWVGYFQRYMRRKYPTYFL